MFNSRNQNNIVVLCNSFILLSVHCSYHWLGSLSVGLRHRTQQAIEPGFQVMLCISKKNRKIERKKSCDSFFSSRGFCYQNVLDTKTEGEIRVKKSFYS